MKVYVVLPDYGQEGLGEPVGVYSCIRLARLAIAEEKYTGREYLVLEHEIDKTGPEAGFNVTREDCFSKHVAEKKDEAA